MARGLYKWPLMRPPGWSCYDTRALPGILNAQFPLWLLYRPFDPSNPAGKDQSIYNSCKSIENPVSMTSYSILPSPPSSPHSFITTFSCRSTASLSDEKILVYYLDTQEIRKCRRSELKDFDNGEDVVIADLLSKRLRATYRFRANGPRRLRD